jgi:hypothetical protein
MKPSSSPTFHTGRILWYMRVPKAMTQSSISVAVTPM